MNLNFNEKGDAIISLEQLESTISLAEFDGRMPASVPKVHHELIRDLLNMAHDAGLEASLSDMVIREKYCKKRKDAQDTRPESYIVNRLAGKIFLPGEYFEGSDKSRPGIAFTYVYDGSLKGIQVAYGMNVNACDNLTVFGDFTFSTNTNSRIPFEKGMELLQYWLKDNSRVEETYKHRIETLQRTLVSPSVVHELVGDLFSRAVRFNNGDKSVKAPLNQSEVSAMVSKGFDKNPGDNVTAWDVLNWGTYVLKPQNSDFSDLITNTAQFGDYLVEKLVPKLELAE